MDRTPEFIEMSLEARGVQKELRDKFDYGRQGYCPQHKCLITEDYDGCPECPGFKKKYHSQQKKAGDDAYTDKWEKKFGFGSPEDCYWNKKWIGLPDQDQLQEMLFATHTLGAKISMFHDFYEPELYCPGEDNSLETSPCKKCIELGTYRRTTFTTMDQLQLAFIMSEKFKKTWIGSKWRLENSKEK